MPRKDLKSTTNRTTRADRLSITKRVKVNGKYKRQYKWHTILELWELWPQDDLSTFALAYEIPYQLLWRRPEFKIEAKRTAMDLSYKPFRARVQNTLKVMVADSNDPDALRKIIKDMTEAAHAHSMIIRSKSVKELPNGEVIANPNMSVSQLKQLSESLKNTSQVMKEILFLSASVPDNKTKDQIGDEPQPVIGKIGA